MEFEPKLLSVVIPIYNVEPYLRKCIESVLNQTYPYIEIIIVDDGSTDASGMICDSYKDNRIKVIHKKHEGTSIARNLGMQYARGEFIGFVDGDDFIDSDMYASMLKELNDTVDIVSCGIYVSFPAEKHLRDCMIYSAPRKIKLNRIDAIEELLKCQLFSFSVCNYVFRRALFEGVTFPPGRTCEDIPVAYTLFTKSQNVINIGKPKYHNFHRADSSSRKDFYFRRVDQALYAGEICKDIKKRYPELLMQAEALYVDYVDYTIQCIKTCQNRIRYKQVEKRLVKVLYRMGIRILHNPCITWNKKKRYLSEIKESIDGGK